MIKIPKPYIQKLQNRKKCLSCSSYNYIANVPNPLCQNCQGTGNEPIELIFPANEIKDWKAGQEIEIPTSNDFFTQWDYAIKNDKLDIIKFKILLLERKKAGDLTIAEVTRYLIDYDIKEEVNPDEEIIIVRC